MVYPTGTTPSAIEPVGGEKATLRPGATGGGDDATSHVKSTSFGPFAPRF